MRLSIIISILNSHEIVRRQILYFEKMNLPDDVELIFVDDGSDPPLSFDTKLKNFTIYQTHDTRAWTVEAARNIGARIANGKYLFMTDIDYIISPEAIEAARNLKHDKMSVRRQFGVLDEHGNFTQDIEVLKAYGLAAERIETRGVNLAPHPNNFAMRRETFFRIGAYVEDRVGMEYPLGGDGEFKRRWTEAYNKGRVTLQDDDLRPTIYMFPNGQFCGDVDFNPFDLFHDLSRKSSRNPYQ